MDTHRTKRRRDNNEINSEYTGLFIVKHLEFFFLYNIKQIDIDGYPYEDEEEPRGNISEIYYVYVIPNPSSITCENILTRIEERSCRMIHIIKYKGSESFVAKSKQLNHMDECSIGDELSNGEGTREMMNSSFYICSKIFGVTSMYLRDKSFRNELPVQDYNFLIYGQSWYERHFGAFPAGRDNVESWKYIKNIIHTYVTREKVKVMISKLISSGYQYTDVFKNYIDKQGEDLYDEPWISLFKGYQSENFDELNKSKILFDKKFLETTTSVLGFIRMERWIIKLRTVGIQGFKNTAIFKSIV